MSAPISMKRILLSLSACAAACAGVRAETSPLSILPDGYGIEITGYNARERGMGEAGMAATGGSGPSLPNPSRTAFNDKTSFSATADGDLDWLSDKVTSNRATTFVIPDIALNFELGRSVNFGLYYRERYQRNFSFTPLTPTNPDAVQTFTTQGGMYQMSATLAYAPIPQFAFALGYNFMLGRERTIGSTAFNQDPHNPDLFNSENLTGDTINIRSNGGFPSLSATFRQKSFSIAASGELQATLDRTFNRTITNMSSAEQSSDSRDLPWTAAVGATYKPRPNQTVAADFSYESWDDAITAADVNPAWHAGAGYEFQGTGGPYESYYSKMAYRGGFGFERLYLDETDLYYLTLGAGLPLGRRGNLLDVAIKYGHRGSLENNLWTEDFIKLSVTLTGVSVWGQPVRKRR